MKKEQKLYLWDWSQVASEGARFENLVASHLLKYCHFLEDIEGGLGIRQDLDDPKFIPDFTPAPKIPISLE